MNNEQWTMNNKDKNAKTKCWCCNNEKTNSYIVQMHWNNIVNNIIGIVNNIIYYM